MKEEEQEGRGEARRGEASCLFFFCAVAFSLSSLSHHPFVLLSSPVVFIRLVYTVTSSYNHTYTSHPFSSFFCFFLLFSFFHLFSPVLFTVAIHSWPWMIAKILMKRLVSTLLFFSALVFFLLIWSSSAGSIFSVFFFLQFRKCICRKPCHYVEFQSVFDVLIRRSCFLCFCLVLIISCHIQKKHNNNFMSLWNGTFLCSKSCGSFSLVCCLFIVYEHWNLGLLSLVHFLCPFEINNCPSEEKDAMSSFCGNGFQFCFLVYTFH